jgi:hypothetical protein
VVKFSHLSDAIIVRTVLPQDVVRVPDLICNKPQANAGSDDTPDMMAANDCVGFLKKTSYILVDVPMYALRHVRSLGTWRHKARRLASANYGDI